jgi:hypothetical protein
MAHILHLISSKERANIVTSEDDDDDDRPLLLHVVVAKVAVVEDVCIITCMR